MNLEVSTPEENSVEENSSNYVPDNADETMKTLSENSDEAELDNTYIEPETENDSAEIIQEQKLQNKQPKLYAGKFKDIENLEKGYKELESKLGAVKHKENEEKLKQAIALGFNSIQDAEIAKHITSKELEFYASKLDLVNPEYYDDARTALLNYANSGNKEYLDLAKQFFNGDLIEECAIFKAELKNHIENKIKQDEISRKTDFLNKLEVENKEFLSDIHTNQAKLNAFKVIFNLGQIQSQEDMDTFISIYNAIKEEGVNSVKSDAQIKSEISNQIEKMQTASDSSSVNGSDEKWFTKAEFDSMSAREYEANQEKIDRQMQLEMEGKIPKQILK
ncbi:MAG: hypothetical protein ACLSWI_01595 [Candidatus Gastranaerophilaceae bacterium]